MQGTMTADNINMHLKNNILEAIGKTPLVKLSKVTDGLPVNIYAKVEYLNPGGSVKDRIAVYMIEEAEKAGIIKAGATIIEATAGNTGMGLALIASVKGYKCIFVLPDKMSQDKINLLKAYGAEVIITPTNVSPDSPESYNNTADRLAREIPNSFRPGQFSNLKNPEAHYLMTGPEIWEDTGGQLDVFVASMGTGGTISGTGEYLKEKNPNILIVGADPEGSILSGDSPKSYKVEGIGEDFVPYTFNRQVIDDMVRVSDAESFHMARRLAKEEGLLVGGSSGTAVAAALKFAQRLPAGKTIVVLLPDSGRNYVSKIFSDEWMHQHGFLDFQPEKTIMMTVLNNKEKMPKLISVNADEPAIHAVNVMQKSDISQLPVLEQQQLVGSINEITLIKMLHDGIDLSNIKVFEIMGKPIPQVDQSVDISEAYRLFMAGQNGVIVTNNNKPIGFVSKIDLVDYWVKRKK